MDELTEIVNRLRAEGKSDDVIRQVIAAYDANHSHSVLGDLGRGLVTGAKSEFSHMLDNAKASMAQMGSNGSRPGDPYVPPNYEPVPRPELPSAASGWETAGRMAGSMAASAPLFMGIGGAIGGVGEAATLARLGPSASKLGLFAKSAVASLPKNIATGVVTTGMMDPSSLKTPEGVAKTVAMSSLGAVASGLFGAFGKGAGVDAAPTNIAASIVEAKLKDPNFMNKIDTFMDHVDQLASDNPLAKPTKLYKAGDQPKTSGPLVVEEGYGTRDWNPKINTKTRIPNDENVQGYSEEIAADIQQRKRVATSIASVVDKIKNNSHSQFDLDRLNTLQMKLDVLTEVINTKSSRMGAYAEDQTGLKFIKGTPSRSVVKFGDNTNSGITNPFQPTPKEIHFKGGPEVVIRPGSNAGSPYPYAGELKLDPITQVLSPKVSGSGHIFDNFTDDENYMLSKIDFMNNAAQEAAVGERTLLNSVADRTDYRAFNLAKPFQKVSDKAFDYATKALRINARTTRAVDDAIYIPNGDGTYARGAESLGPMIREMNGDAKQLAKFNIYAQSRQAVSDKVSNLDLGRAQSIVDAYAKDEPQIVDIYNRRHTALVVDMLKASKAYNLFPASVAQSIEENPQWAPLTRSHFGDPSGSEFLKRRGISDAVIGDYFHSMYANIKGITRMGERSEVLRSLLDARVLDPDRLTGIIDIVPAKEIPNLAEKIAALPADIPEVVRKAYIEAFATQPEGNTHSVIYNGVRVRVKLNDELNNSLDLLRGLGTKDHTPANETLLEKYGTHPLNAAIKAEKTATSVFSVYRDIFRGGVVTDAMEMGLNANAQGFKFSALVDPIKGFIGLYKSDPFLQDIAGHGGIKGIRYADPNAESGAEDVEHLINMAKQSGIMLRVMHPAKAFSEFAGNLSNASSAGLVLANQNMRKDVLATAYNGMIGDPAMKGATLAAWGRMTGFMNYPMQANIAQINAMLNRQSGSLVGEVGKRLPLALAKSIALVTGPTMLASYLTRDNQKVNDLRNSPQGRRFIYFPSPFSDEIIAFRKAQGPWGVLLSTLPEQLIEEIHDSKNTDLMHQVGMSLVNELTPNFLPMIMNTAYGAVTGKSLNTQDMSVDNVTPASRTGLLPEDAAGASVTNTAQVLAKTFGGDAARWDRVFKGLLIGGSFNAFQHADRAVGGDVGKSPLVPQSVGPRGIGGFLNLRHVDENAGGDAIVSKLYDKLGGLEPILKSFTAAANLGQIERLRLIHDQFGDKFAEAYKVEAYISTIQAYNNIIKRVSFSEQLSQEQKKTQIDKYKGMRTEAARNALTMLK